MIVDFHTHIFPPWVRDNRAHYLERDPCFRALYTSPRARMVTAEELLESMDREGIDVSITLNLGWVSHELCVETNDYILEAASRYPHRLVAFCALQPRAVGRALEELERCVRGGARGIGELRSDIQGFDLGDGRVMGPLVEAAKRHGLILLTHASEPLGHHYSGKGNITPEHLFRLVSISRGLSLVLAHWGGGLPFYALMPEVGGALGGVYFDTAASPLLYQDEVYSLVARLVGPEKVLFGSDYPLLGQGRMIQSILSLDLSDEVKGKLLGGNARRLLGLGGAGGG